MDKTRCLIYKKSIMYRFYIHNTAVQGKTAELSGQDAKHLVNVLRIRCGETIELFDGKGLNLTAEVKEIAQGSVKLAVMDTFAPRCESPIHLSLAQGMLKDRKMDKLIRHLTELGAAEWIPFWGERSVPKPDKKRIQQRMKRWEKIAKESLKQCRRSLLPLIHTPLSFDQLMDVSQDYGMKIAFFENATCSVKSILDKNSGAFNKFLVLIGPEGGFSDREMDLAEKYGFQIYSLGPRILRAETASIAACALIQNFFGDLG
ncbi:MAG: 16S rRNA (uracil(1498)-N(3))-methyltransferase [Thermodesulfobacteriota bacterium]|nr:16S rRNA (uracil(1498)-N(3))-methyltransferase [Thermodesulfobacteriota bacterium]